MKIPDKIPITENGVTRNIGISELAKILGKTEKELLAEMESKVKEATNGKTSSN